MVSSGVTAVSGAYSYQISSFISDRLAGKHSIMKHNAIIILVDGINMSCLDLTFSFPRQCSDHSSRVRIRYQANTLTVSRTSGTLHIYPIFYPTSAPIGCAPSKGFLITHRLRRVVLFAPFNATSITRLSWQLNW
eukprot:sb/3474689/